MRLSLSLSLSLLLRPAFKVCKRFGPRRLLIRWVYSHTSREDFQSMYTNLLDVSFKIEIFKMSTDICYLSHATKAQTSLRKFAFSIQRDTHPSLHTKSGYHRPSSEMPFKWRFAGGLVVALLGLSWGVDARHHLLYVKWLCLMTQTTAWENALLYKSKLS